ncbi:MAG: putative immunity protein [Massiliimalia sp.]|jgi:hypothetical protein
MAKLRKMLGNPQDEEVIALMRQIETQSLETLARWALSYAQEMLLPIYEEMTQDLRFRPILVAVEQVLSGERKLGEIKPQLREAREKAKLTQDPIAQAAARGIATACAVLQTPTNSLGFCFYGAAAVIYHREGIQLSPDQYDQLAKKEFTAILDSLKKKSLAQESNPVKVNWNC